MIVVIINNNSLHWDYELPVNNGKFRFLNYSITLVLPIV